MPTGSDDIVTRLRGTEAYWKGTASHEDFIICGEAADEIERLREQIKALVHEWELSERGIHYEQKEVRGEI